MTEVPPPIPVAGTRQLGDDAGMRMLLPVGRSGWAIAAGYVGLISVLMLPAPLAVILSIIAIRDIRKSRLTQQRKYGYGRAVFGFVMGVLGTLAGIGVLYLMWFGDMSKRI